MALVLLSAAAMGVHPMTAVTMLFGAPADTPARSILFLLVVVIAHWVANVAQLGQAVWLGDGEEVE